jgi:hypothetical protein
VNHLKKNSYFCHLTIGFGFCFANYLMCCLGRRKVICLGPNAPFDPLAYQANRSSDQTIGFLTVLSNHYFISSPHLTLLSSLDETSFEPGGKSARHQAFNLFEQPQLQCQ